MAEAELSKALKDLPIRLQTSRRKERRAVIEKVIGVLKNPGVNENVIKGLCKVLHIALQRYRDSGSQAVVKDYITALVKHHGDWTIKHMTSMLSDVAAAHKTLIPTKNTAQTGLYALVWSSLLIQNGWKKCSESSKSEFQRLMEVQATLLLVVVAAEDSLRSHKAYQTLSMTWSMVPESIDVCSNILTGTSEPSAQNTILGAYLIQYLSTEKKVDLINKYKGPLTASVAKVAIGSKVKPPPYLIRECEPLLRHISHEEFGETLLPALQKAMLRSPEVALESVGILLSKLSLDLSRYAIDLGRNIIANLHSKEDLTRDEAAEACRYLALQCSDSGSIEELLQHIFAVFHGSEGKLTVATHKISVLQGAGNLSNNGVTGSSVHKLASFAADHFIKVLQNEVHEGTLIQALDMFSLWCAKFSNDVPNNVLEWFKKGPTLKTSTVAVRTSYIQCMAVSFSGNTLYQGAEFFPQLQKVVEKAFAQPTQVPVVTEALSAACLLLKISTADVSVQSKMAGLMTILLDMEKQLFVSEKFLSLASEDESLVVALRAACVRLGFTSTDTHSKMFFLEGIRDRCGDFALVYEGIKWMEK